MSQAPSAYEPPDPLEPGLHQEQQDAAAERRVLELVQMCTAYRDTFSSEAGRRVLADLENRCHYQTSTHLEPGYPYEMTFREGRRSVVCEIHAAMSPQEPKYLREQLLEHRDRDPFEVLQPRRAQTHDDSDSQGV